MRVHTGSMDFFLQSTQVASYHVPPVGRKREMCGELWADPDRWPAPKPDASMAAALFCPLHHRGAEVVAELADSFYHLPLRLRR